MKRGRWPRVAAALGAALLLSACAALGLEDEAPPPDLRAPIDVPAPAGYDLALAEAEAARGEAALAEGEAGAATAAFEAAVAAWPLYVPAWDGLAKAAKAAGDEATAARARFFADRADWAADTYPPAAAMALRNAIEQPPGERYPQLAEPAYKRSAERMIAFLEAEDRALVVARQARMPDETLVQKYGIYPALLVGAGLTLFGGGP